MIITASVSGHSPKVTAKFTYDTSTQKASVTWTVGSGTFRYKFFRFYISLARLVNGSWKFTDTLIGGMSGSGGTNIWKSGSASVSAPIGSNTKCCFDIYCSALKDGGTCDSGWGSGITRVTDYYDLTVETIKPTLSLKSDSKWYDPVEKETQDTHSKYTDKLYVHWATSGVAPSTIAAKIYKVVGNSTQEIKYSSTALYAGVTSGDITFTVTEPATWYQVKFALSSDQGETIESQWANDYTTKNFRTRDYDPYVYFENASCSGTTATFSYKSVSSSGSVYVPLATLRYKLTDKTTGTSTTGYIFQNVGSSDSTSKQYTGTHTLTGLTAGHTYVVEPVADTCSSVDHVPMAQGYASESFMGAVPPTIQSISNVGDSLIFGEPDGNPAINVAIGGTENVWNITLKIGTGISNGVVQYPILTTSASVGTNKISLSDDILDTIYKRINISSYVLLFVSIEYYIAASNDNYGDSYASKTMVLNGNAKTAKVGVAGKTRRAKAWVGVAGKRHRAVIWAGVAGSRRRVL